ncbi:hypothetical protein OIE66_37665 [Nonomuraea sp. NBC_01738]|uniref:hypothetical protein n=1 Tax=Nonomuraea sp. NBC_01738 TaxID=2976003 RepID=UPI002E11344B|nr:hypothetical protein OIE66_37665 [Nonomuraea sp. NBC_01738]
MRRAFALVGLALVTACGAGSAGVRVEGTAPPPGKPVYVMAYMGDPLQRPATFALTEFSSISNVRWTSWGGGQAVGEGEVSGTWCLPGCLDHGYPATITLSGLTWLERTGYYGRFTVTSAHKLDEDLTDQKLEVPKR